MPPSVALKEHSEMVLEDGHEGDRRGLHKYIVDRQLVKMQTLVDWQEGQSRLTFLHRASFPLKDKHKASEMWTLVPRINVIGKKSNRTYRPVQTYSQ